MVVGGFDVESRGEVIIKGKGVMETYWLIGRGSGDLRRATISPMKNYEEAGQQNVNALSNDNNESKPIGIYQEFKNNGAQIQ
ncbi:hypothetical protein COOONC_13939 [Cooperia oncophora]